MAAEHKSTADRLHRLFRPKSIAFIGGREAEIALRRTQELGFPGRVYAVNPKREEMAGLRCLASPEDLPEAVDAAFVGVPRGPTIDIVRRLGRLGCGGAVLYASGFTETGDEGASLQQELLQAAGGMPVMGPNCYGYVSAMERCALWPDVHNLRLRDRGVAIVTQSGNMGLNFTFTQRGLPVAAVYTLGNQADIGIADMVEVFAADPRVNAIGLHIEGLADLPRFAEAAARARLARKPIVVLKTGRSDAGARVAKSHTGSLAGADRLYDAMFERYGIIRAASMTGFVETLKFLSIVGPLPGNRVVSLSCSGGEAALVADMAEGRGLTFPPFGDSAAAVRATLNDYVAIENPLDYHTFIWGKPDQQMATFSAALAGPFDAGILILDMPTGRLERSDWVAAAEIFAGASEATGRPAAVVATLHECLPEEVCEMLARRGVAPMLGLDDALTALEAAAKVHEAWLREMPPALPQPVPAASGLVRNISEQTAKALLARFGVPVPWGEVCPVEQAAAVADRLGYPVVLKASGDDLLHKSDVGGVAIDLRDRAAVEAAAQRLSSLSREVLVERMVTGAVCEVIVGVIEDPQFGQALVIGAGGVLAELLRDSATVLLPTSRQEVERALDGLKIAKLLEGFRGKYGDRPALVETMLRIADFARAHAGRLVELDVNPLLVLAPGEGVVAVDALVRMRD
ncbi:acetate--CoA ligase family protein [Rhodoligotrophos defluvii]|uniref:acetate--CoA ligase family protein n=1 Tax=Rhodoligotrophos defluvii TaxID=2561934 RepID=UPI0010C94ABB|nr:acetate--CoA ligase family protein [Rhodoligotrophos defluvii]